VADTAHVTTASTNGKNGTWLIDPVDFTIAATGADMTGAALTASLGGGNVSILSSSGTTGTSGNINVNDTVAWSANTLTLNAYNNININSMMNARGTAGLALLYGQGATNGVINGVTATDNVNAPVNLAVTGSFTTQLGSNGQLTNYTIINSLGVSGSTTGTDLQGINGGLTGNYVLGANIDATATSTWNANAGFMPIGNATTSFGGTFDGLGHTISNLTQSNSLTDSGLFGQINSTGTVTNTGLLNVAINHSTAGAYSQKVGALAGTNSGTISNVYSTGALTNTGNTYTMVGGLVGNNAGTVSNAYSSATVTGSFGDYMGGLVGNNARSINTSYATGTINGGSAGTIGGLLGMAQNSSTITNSYATGAVIGNGSTNYLGGLIGAGAGSISNSYATGAVSGGSGAGGLIGMSNATIVNAYATGAVSGSASDMLGGLIGMMGGGSITNAYATGSIANTGARIGGLIGSTSMMLMPGSISHTFWDVTTSGQITGIGGQGASQAGATGLTTAQMQTTSNFTGFTFTTMPGAPGNNWVIIDANGTLNNAASAAGAAFPMLSSEYSTTINNGHQLQLMAMNLAGSYTLGQNINVATTGMSTDVWSSAGFVPIGNAITSFAGTFDGLGHTISNLTQSNSLTDSGLFGQINSTGTVTNTGLLDVAINHSTAGTYSQNAGALAGSNSGMISNVYSTGALTNTGNTYTMVGGLIGSNTGIVTNAYSSAILTGSFGDCLGGLVGNNAGSINTSYTTGTINGGSAGIIGGLLGMAQNSSTITNSYATGAVIGNGSTNNLGGLIGYGAGSISNSYATGAVSGGSGAGGLIGMSNATIVNAYATGAVSGSASDMLGGLIGMMGGGSITNAYATGSVANASDRSGGLIGSAMMIMPGSISKSFWDVITSGQTTGIGGQGTSQAGTTGLTTAQMQTVSSFTGWDFTTKPVWKFASGVNSGYPILCNVTGACAPLSIIIYLDMLTGTSSYGSTPTYTYGYYTTATYGSGTEITDAAPTGSVIWSNAPAATSNIGSYVVQYSGGINLGNSAYTLLPGNAVNWTVTALPVTLTGSTTYNGLASIAGSLLSLSNAVNRDTVVVGGSGTLASKSAGSESISNLTGLTLNNANYTLAGGSGTVTITKAPLTISATSGSKVYDGTTSTLATPAVTSGTLFGGDSLTGLSQSFASRNGIGSNGSTLAVNNTYTLSDGNNGNNYNVTLATATGTITPKAITETGLSVAASRVYDATINATVLGTAILATEAAGAGSATDGKAYTGDAVALTGTATGKYNSQNVATAKTVTFGGLALNNSNYTLTMQAPLAATITPKAISETGLSVAASRVYDGTTNATVLGHAVLATAEKAGTGTATDGKPYNAASLKDLVAITGTASATYNTKDVATANMVSFGGLALNNSNYTLTMQASVAATISPALLRYIAIQVSSVSGQTPSGLTGSVTGFVSSDTLANATTGSLVWTTPATSSSPAGLYAITGSGLTASNYTFVQAAGNATALTIKNSIPN
jgi:hypothetical protein